MRNHNFVSDGSLIATGLVLLGSSLLVIAFSYFPAQNSAAL